MNDALLSHHSVSVVLQALGDHRAPGVPITARALPMPPCDDGEARRVLAAKSGEPLVHRRVALRWGDEVLSRADNWYLPDRLTPQMNRDLANTDTPFGIIAAPLKFLRRNLAVEALFQPLPEDWERRNPAEFAEPLVIPAAVLRHAAVLTTPDGRAFSFVVETYTDRVLAL